MSGGTDRYSAKHRPGAPVQKERPRHRLAEFRDQVLAAWEESARQAIPAAQTQDRAVLRRSFSDLLEQLALSLAEVSGPETTFELRVPPIAKEHATERAAITGYSLDQLIYEYHLLQRALFDMLEGTGAIDAFERDVILDAVQIAIREAASEFARQQQARLGAALGALDDFLSICAHELRTPVTSVQLTVQLLRRTLDRAPALDVGTLQKALSGIETQAKSLGQLISRLLDVSRMRNQRLVIDPAEMDLAAAARDVLLGMRPHFERAEVAVSFAALAPVVGLWDRLRIEQVVTNLIGNALKYGAGRPVEVRVHRDRSHAVLEVEDHGIGIAAAEQARIFRRFERATSEFGQASLGLGLYIAHEIVLGHRGTIVVSSRLGEGTTFTVRLPFP